MCLLVRFSGGVLSVRLLKMSSAIFYINEKIRLCFYIFRDSKLLHFLESDFKKLKVRVKKIFYFYCKKVTVSTFFVENTDTTLENDMIIALQTSILLETSKKLIFRYLVIVMKQNFGYPKYICLIIKNQHTYSFNDVHVFITFQFSH